MSAADRFYQIERQLVIGRARGTISEELEDEFLEESDELWRLMTPEEREEADRRVRGYLAPDAPDDIHLVERTVADGGKEAPRMAAA